MEDRQEKEESTVGFKKVHIKASMRTLKGNDLESLTRPLRHEEELAG